jgi:3-hydroxyacyl-[acyl-carrier-protein] dehydratase
MSVLDTIVMDTEEIKKFIPHREPFLLIDSVHELNDHKNIIASKLLLPEAPIFAGHFPGNPVYPGVYYIESIAQAGAILLFKSYPDHLNSLGLLSSVESARFRKPCKPGDRVCFDVAIEKHRGLFFWIKGKAFVNNDTIAEVKLSVALIPK